MSIDLGCPTPRSGGSLFARLLFAGLQVDWRYSLVVILVITGMFSTPLALGSIRNRVYTAVKEQIEKENNAREIRLELAAEGGRPLNDSLIAELEESFPGFEAVGNRKLIVGVQGPEGADLLTLQTLDPGDPRTTPLGIVPGVPEDFAAGDLILSDRLGRRLFGEAWSESNTAELSDLKLSLSINDLPVLSEFRVVARRTLPGVALYASPEVGAALRRYTLGFGAPEFGLPADDELLQAALPELVTDRCQLLLADEDPTCSEEDRVVLKQRLLAQQHQVLEQASPQYPPLGVTTVFSIALWETVEVAGGELLRPRQDRCEEVLSPFLVDRCTRAEILEELALRAQVRSLPPAELETSRSVEFAALPREKWNLLTEWEGLRDRLGEVPSDVSFVAVTIPATFDLALGETVWVTVGESQIPVRVASFYQCTVGMPCPWIVEPLSLFRLQNLRDQAVELAHLEPLLLIPQGAGDEFDQILAYIPQVEEVPAVADHLRGLFPDLNVQYNSGALDKLRRQDSRLSVLFSLTMALSALFLILALAALARINLERRSRQMAQFLILGFRRRFVRLLVVAEYLLLTAISAASSLVLTAALFGLARSLLRPKSPAGGNQDFAVIVESMNLDFRAFFLVFAGVLVCTGVIAMVTSHRAANADPLSLLD